MSYKGKPVIVGERPWWRHPRWAWGWYSLSQDAIDGESIAADGHYEPGDCGDMGAGLWRWDKASEAEANGGTIIQHVDCGRMLRVWEFKPTGDTEACDRGAFYVWRDGVWEKLHGNDRAPEKIYPNPA